MATKASMDELSEHDQSDGLDRFTATGRPFAAYNMKGQYAAKNSIAGAESFGAAPGNHAPVKFTDASLIPVATLRSPDIGKNGDQKTEKGHWWSLKRRADNTNFVMRNMPRGEYLKHYAKDDNGKYIGSEEPAADCILRGEDLVKYRGGSISGSTKADVA